MKLLLCKSVEHLGIVGDVVNVSTGYARNYLLPHGLATEPTKTNVRLLAEARKVAERERAEERARLAALAEKIKGVEITIAAKANEEGLLYGSVGKREISHALEAEGFFIKPDHIILEAPIRHLDNVNVEIRLVDDVRSTIKVWVVREKSEGEEESQSKKAGAGTEAGKHDDGRGA